MEFKCVICKNPTIFEDDICDSCGDRWNQYHDDCWNLGKLPTKEEFSKRNNPKIWDYLI